MKKKILMLSLWAAMSGTVAADEYGYMVFTLNDGTTQSISTEGLSLNFGNGKLTAKSGTNTLTIQLEDLKKMAFSSENVTGIESIGNTQATIDSQADIYNLRGQKVTKDQLEKGVYIVKTKDKTYKVIVK